MLLIMVFVTFMNTMGKCIFQTVLKKELSYVIKYRYVIVLVTQCTIVLIRKNIGSIKFISGEASI